MVDAIPTIGKTSAAAQFAAELCEGERDTKLTYLTHRTANREQFEEMIRQHVSDGSVTDMVHLPVLEDDCPTARGDHGSGWQSRLISLRDQGLSPASLHRNQKIGLPCGGTECPYLDWWTNDESSDVFIGHLSHAYVPEIVDERVVIIDEDPGDAFQTRFSASELHQLVGQFLKRDDDLPVKDLDSLKLLRQDESTFGDARETIHEYASDVDPFDLGGDIVQSGHGHVDAALVVQALLEPTVDEKEGLEEGSETYRVVLENDVEHIHLADSVVVAYDPQSGELALRNSPDFSRTAALVGLDGTPTPELWKGRLGVDKLSHVQVLCDECRQKYLSDVLGYQLIQTSSYVKPYSGAQPKRISFEKDRGLLHEVQRRADSQVGLITTKGAKTRLLSYEDENDVAIPDELVGHYRNIKGSNEFEGDEVQIGVIIGSPHPGPDELRLLAGLNGDIFDTEVVEETRDGHHYSRREPVSEAEPYLNHVRENSVAQAILRFGRQDGATVFVHTSAVPEWMHAICKSASVEPRPDGEQAVLRTLESGEEASTGEIADHTPFSTDTVRNQLKELEEQQVVDRQGDQHRIIWKATDSLRRVSPTARVKLSVTDFSR
ncbi:hypothetical protein [Halorientalis marina]|uniref:hypothetical protein n=1 Tax=Halorientalis marina TaxID=2931976 RepID=UPI001FF5DA3D|nr:hypothetical protein [Halorientalis marina]